jgi:hypothetical protein
MLAAALIFPACHAHAQPGENPTGNVAGFGGSATAVFRTRTVTSISAGGDVSLNLGQDILQAGQAQIEDIDETSTLSWSSSVEEPNLNKITAVIAIGSLPPGLELRVTLPGSPGVILGGTAQDLVPNVGNETRSEPLTYRLVVTDFEQLSAATEPLTILYTIGPQ